MEMRVTTSGEINILQLDGRYDAFEVPQVSKWFDEQPNLRYVVVNMSGVGFIDSSGLASLVKGMKRCRQNQGDLYLCGLQQAVTIIFELVSLNKAFNIFADESTAVGRFAERIAQQS